MSKSIKFESPEHTGRTIRPNPPEYNTQAAEIVDSSVTTDSVVATATVVTGDSTRRLKINWGDGDEDVVNHRPGLPVPVSSGNSDDPLPEGTYKLYHRYDLTESSEPYEFSVNVRVDDVNGGVAAVSHDIVITPRYRVTHYPLSFRLENWCDSAWETRESEFKIRQVIYQDNEQKVENSWGTTDDPVVYPQDYNIGPGPNFRLDGSGWSREMTADELIREDWTFMEVDLLVDDWIDYFLISGPATQTERYSDVSEVNTTMSGCSITLTIPEESELLVPLPRSDSAVFAPDV